MSERDERFEVEVLADPLAQLAAALGDERAVAALAEALHEANIDCDYSSKFDRKSCLPGDGPHSIAARAIAAALRSER